MKYKHRIQLYIQFYYERGIADRTLLTDIKYKDLDYPIRGKFTKEAQKQALTNLLPLRVYNPYIDEWHWELKEVSNPRRG